ncbi:hypothetical protein N7536_005311 [Penicillium majusculum]|uniref:Chromatin modification-related protein n=1 Tax=Penicillium solitum TaxID=60172 RepID=A0A1V6RNE9_9EURO|nr:uncharacterized protein PENSOL_c001G03015 [Penicillium solitum]KAJ5694899.1 hypothetical protein N7536_005311 [Penicillium majusculum]OQE03315.1 hypothetical protein PENSOL_c001G03015 [Penicillium solitum]
MPMTDDTDDSGGVILDGPFDPDAQATVTDFIDYTEYLPADLIRSLTLIRGLDDRYLDSAQAVHQLTQIYGQLPDLPPDNRPGAIALRKDISSQVDRAINARESAYAEACRLYDVVDRHFDRLGCIRQKLEALPKPASEEPSPPPEPTPKRARGGKKTNKDATTRITLRLDNNRNRRDKNRRRMLGADGAFDPDSPLASTEQSDLESELIKSAPKPARPSKKEKIRRLSLGNGPSTAQALAQLKPPPTDAKLGSEDLPWLRLTEWEMTRLRKKMKKNAVWQPSEVMIHRELALANRGWEAYRAAKTLAEETGGEFIDCDNIEETRRGEAAKDLEETKLSNRGMKLNEAKKLKREQLAREQALMEGEGGVLPRPLPSPAQAPPAANRSSRKRKREEVILEATELASESPNPTPVAAPVAPPAPIPVPAPSSRAGPSRRRSSRGAVPAAETNNDLIPPIKTHLSPAVETKLSPPLPSPTGSGPSNPSLVQPVVTTPTPPVTRPSSRRSIAAASIEGGNLITIPTAIAASGRDRRIKSATPAHKTPIRESSHAPSVPGPARRRKRPAPGPISSGQDGGAAVSYGRRKAKPGKKRLSIRDSQDVRVDEDGVLEQIDANEPRYCLCGDVSFGTMICCENQDCDREWFHLNCVGLTEVPSRTAKWYCPQCRVKLHKGEDGIIKGSSRR